MYNMDKYHHSHDHEHNCCGNHNHGHDHCCGSHGGCCGSSPQEPIDLNSLSESEQNFLKKIIKNRYLPVSQFVLKSSTESHFESVALSPVFIETVDDSMEQVRKIGAMLKALEKKGYITLDFDIPLGDYTYEEYHNSQLFSYFKSTVEEGKNSPDFLGDIADIETGSMALTDECLIAIKESNEF